MKSSNLATLFPSLLCLAAVLLSFCDGAESTTGTGSRYLQQDLLLEECETGCQWNVDCVQGNYCRRNVALHLSTDCHDLDESNDGPTATTDRVNVCLPQPPNSIVVYSASPPASHLPLGMCQGDCDRDLDCEAGLYCHQRDAYDEVPNCQGGDTDRSKTDYCTSTSPTPNPVPQPTPNPVPQPTPNPAPQPTSSPVRVPVRAIPKLVSYGGNPPPERFPLGMCEGDCQVDFDCATGLYCFQRTAGGQAVPFCDGGESDNSRTDYCTTYADEVRQPTVAPVPASPPNNLPKFIQSYGGNPPTERFPLGLCEGDCDRDSHCQDGLRCLRREAYDPIPGCLGMDSSPTDYCVPVQPNLESNVYKPGMLTVYKDGVLLSNGLDVKIVARSLQKVEYKDQSKSQAKFHERPDAGACFPDTRPGNEGGWVYVSNSEMRPPVAFENVSNEGGVGALTFDKDGNIIDYKMVLENSNWNCGGGKTPWNTWVSCEEYGNRGIVYQVDPFGERNAQQTTIGKDKGAWESFAYDDRDPNHPRFFVTEDKSRGALERFSPSDTNAKGWDLLHGDGKLDYLVLVPNSQQTGGSYYWTTNRNLARDSAQQYYPDTEGIDVDGNQLFFVCKKIKFMYTLNLDDRTYTRESTTSGLFDGGPDQLKRVLGDDTGLLYFTEDGGRDSGIHGRDGQGRFYTILESPDYKGETSGLAFSPDARYMMLAYQDEGIVFMVWRKDGLSFDGAHLDVNYH